MRKISWSGQRFFYVVTAILVLITIIVSLQSYSTGTWEAAGGLHSNFNNYLIFKTSATHLIQGLDLYVHHPGDHVDLFKYSPLFALLMAPFTILPDWLGIIIWNLINLLTLMIGLRMMPGLGKKQVTFILLIAFFELIGSIMNEQSNALMAGLMVLGIACFEKNKPFWGALSLVFSVYIKLFSLVVFMMLLFYPKRLKTALYTVFWMIVFALLPILVTGWDGLKETYLSWYTMLGQDYSDSVGFSVIGILVKWFNYQGSRNIVFLVGVVLMVMPLLKFKQYSNQNFRYAVLSALLIWIIIFNHKAESPTFVIAMTGIGLYFVTQPWNLQNKLFLAFAIVFVSLVYSDLMPPGPRNNFFHPYFIKALPCIVIWLKIIYEIMFNKIKPAHSNSSRI